MARKLSKVQIDLLQSMRDARGKHGLYTMDRHYEATTFRSLHQQGLIGFYVLPRMWVATKYKITPAGRSALCQAEGRP
jgi:hypothetical protein